MAVRVYARFRPLKPGETRSTELTMEDGHISMPTTNQLHSRRLSFPMTNTFQDDATQEDVYEGVCSSMINQVHEGVHATIMAYGMSGSGKTFTLFGDGQEQPGLVKQTLHALWDELDDDVRMQCRMQVIEIYNERLRDMIQSSNTPIIREDKHGVYVDRCMSENINSPEHAWQTIENALKNRTVAETSMNEHSSRSHCVVIMKLGILHPNGVKVVPTVTFVDLAGSENVNVSKVSGVTLKQAANINRSLSTLSRVIRLLKDGADYVPYRDSKLTRLLSNSLGGNATVALIITCVADSKLLRETSRSLLVGQDATNVKNTMKPAKVESVTELKKALHYSEQLRTRVLERLGAKEDEYQAKIKLKDAELEEKSVRINGLEQKLLSTSMSQQEMDELLQEIQDTPITSLPLPPVKKTSFTPAVNSSRADVNTGVRRSPRSDLDSDEEQEERLADRLTQHSRSHSFHVASQGHIVMEATNQAEEEEEDEEKRSGISWEEERDHIESDRDELISQLAELGDVIQRWTQTKEHEQQQQQTDMVARGSVDVPDHKESTSRDMVNDQVDRSWSTGYMLHLGGILSLSLLSFVGAYLQWGKIYLIPLVIAWIVAIILLLLWD